MTKRSLLMTLPLLVLAACGEGQEGDPCTTDEDCAEGLICHDHAEDGHEGHDHGKGEGEAEDGVCEPPDAHDHEDEDDTGAA